MNNTSQTQPTKLVDLFFNSFDTYVDSKTDTTVDPRDLNPGEYGFLGNPFDTGDYKEDNRLYEEYFLKRVGEDKLFYRSVLGAYGKKLGCLGDPKYSHGQTILNWLHGQKANYEKVFGPIRRTRY